MDDKIKQFCVDIGKKIIAVHGKDNESMEMAAFIVAPLYQALNKMEDGELLACLHTYDYRIFYVDVPDKRQCKWLVKIVFTEKGVSYDRRAVNDNRAVMFNIWTHATPVYSGYCQCEPGMDGYREDKDCCGHGCDWDRPDVIIEKIEPVTINEYDGDQHDYWNFEDMFKAELLKECE